jgi:hypothetical protein
MAHSFENIVNLLPPLHRAVARIPKGATLSRSDLAPKQDYHVNELSYLRKLIANRAGARRPLQIR